MSDTVLVELIRNNLITKRVIDAFFYGHNRKYSIVKTSICSVKFP